MKHQEKFDAILLDVPCSSERHVLNSPTHLHLWKRGRTKNLAVQAASMVAAALDSLKPNGYLLYSTCALSAEENDKVWEKMTRKRTHWDPLELSLDYGEKTQWGRIILPDVADGWGPMYMVLVKKLPAIL